MLFEQRVDLVIEPTQVAELEGVAQIARQFLDKRLQAGEVAGPLRRGLEEDHAEAVFEKAGAGEEAVELGFDVLEPFQMGDDPGGFDREEKAGRSALPPAAKRGLRG